MRTFFAYATMLVVMPVLSGVIIAAGMLGIRHRPGGLYERIPRFWARIVLWCAGTRVVHHHLERARGADATVYVSNHVSWFDIFVLLAVLPRYRFVAKVELFRIPLFGRAARIAGTIPIRRDNRAAALEAYEEAAQQIRQGASVVVYPEGTRGQSYSLRPFKKGPFVLAIAAQAPIVPIVIHGTREVQPKGSYAVRAGFVQVHVLDAIPTTGLTYDDREELAAECWNRMAAVMEREYGVVSAPPSTLVDAAATLAAAPADPASPVR
jgi:1-acyl-sn-glycerol-3-phosphate acyltransferase